MSSSNAASHTPNPILVVSNIPTIHSTTTPSNPQLASPNTGRAFKYQFDLELKKVKLLIPFKCFVQLSWRRGNKSITTKNKVELLGEQKQFNVSERLSMMSTCYVDDVTRKFTEKNSILEIIININGMNKCGGSCNIDLSDVLNPLAPKTSTVKHYDVPLAKCPIKNSSISFSLSATYLQEMVTSAANDENLSLGSAVAYSSFSDFNLSFQSRKHAFEAPSKDSVSVHSVNRDDVQSTSRGNSNFKRRIQVISQFNAPASIQNSFVKRASEQYGTRGDSISKHERASLKDEKLREDKFRSDTQNTQLKLMVSEQSKKLNQYLNECSQLRLEIKSLKSSAEKHDSQKKALLQERQKISQQMISWKVEAEKARSECASLRENRQHIEVEIERKRVQECSQYQKQIQNLQGLISNQMRDIECKLVEKEKFENLKSEYQRYRARVQGLENECQRYRELLENEKNNLQAYLNKLSEKDAAVENLKRESDRVFLEKQELVKNRAELLDQLNNTSSKLNEVNTEYRNLQKALLLNNRNLEETKRELQRVRAENQAAKMELSNSQMSTNQHEQEFMMMSSNLQLGRQEIEKLRTEIEKYRENNLHLNKECVNLSEYVSQLQKENERMAKEKQGVFRDRQKVLREKETVIREKESLIKEKDAWVKQVGEAESAINKLKHQIEQLQQDNVKLKAEAIEIGKDTEQLTIQVSQLIRENEQLVYYKEQIQLNSQNQDSQLMKENLELEVKVKVQEEEIVRLKKECQEVQQLRNKINFEIQSAKEAEEQLLAVEKQLREKSRMLIIEAERTKMFFEENTNLNSGLNEKNFMLQLEQQKNETLLSNLRELQVRLAEIEGHKSSMLSEIRSLEAELARKSQKSEETKALEKRIMELEAVNTERVKNLEEQSRALNQNEHAIRDLTKAMDQKTKEVAARQQAIQALETKLHHQQISGLGAKDKITQLQKRVSMLMEEVCVWRSKQQSQNSNTSAYRELESRIHSLESTLSRRQQKIRRLEKQNNKLEEENIQLNIRIMKELTEMQRKQEGIKKEYCKTLNKVLSESNI